MATNVFELYAKIGADTKDFDKGLSSAKDKFSGFADGLKNAAGKVGDILAGIGKAAAAGIGAASTALVGLTKQTLDAVGSFEQLEGGAQKIFDEMDFDKISTDAKNAYRELNMSASEYLEAINLAGATFAQTMGDEKGYDTARKGMLAIADYASGTGRNLEELNQKYQMITRATSSYQSIADQFAGILPATSKDFLEQAQAAGFLKDTYEKLTDVPVAEYQQALTDMLDSGVNKLGLSNNTLRESTETLTGSFAMARAAWQNFLTGQGSTQDFVKAFSSAIEQTRSKLDEIIPRLTDGMTELVDLLAPEIPPIIEETLPSVIEGSSVLLTGLAKRLPQLMKSILPSLSEGVINVTTALVGAMPDLITSIKESIPIVVQTIMSKKDELAQAGKDIIGAIFPKQIDPESLGKIVSKGDEIIWKLIDGLLSEESIDAFIETAPQIIENLVEAIKTVLLGGDQDGEGGIFGAAKNIVEKLGDYFADEKNRENFWNAAFNIIESLGKGIISILQNGVAPLLVEVGKAWAQAFIGSIDYNDTAYSILSRLAEAFAHNMTHFGFIGQLIESDANRDDYVNATGYNGTIDQWNMLSDDEKQSYLHPNLPSIDVEATVAGMRKSGVPGAGINAYLKAHGYAKGGVFNRPTYALIGEDGAEAVMPLEKNTGWIDRLAVKLNTGTGGIVIENITINAPTGNAEDIRNAFVIGLDEKLKELQIAQNRGIGGVTW